MNNDTTDFCVTLAEAENELFTDRFGDDAEFTRDEISPLIAYHLSMASSLARQVGVSSATWTMATKHAYRSELHDDAT